ncbi:MAG: MmcQ/YjbR family DNA-binding protein [Eubacterium sp.]|nr:MmcQ/YjbR family DNA-binding protein [Eubacterium sp.]
MLRQEAIDYIENEFGVEGEQLWIQFPDYAVFRNRINKKWFALIGSIERNKLGLEGKERADFINLKCDPILIGSLLHNKGFFPAYHMNKKSWLTVILDGSVNGDELKDLIHLSYEIIEKKK